MLRHTYRTVTEKKHQAYTIIDDENEAISMSFWIETNGSVCFIVHMHFCYRFSVIGFSLKEGKTDVLK